MSTSKTAPPTNPKVKKFSPFFFVFFGLLLGGCAVSVPVSPAMFMLMRNDPPAPKLEIMPAPDAPETPNPMPAQAPTAPA